MFQIKLIKNLSNENYLLEIKGTKGLSFIPIFKNDAEQILKQQHITDSTLEKEIRIYNLN